MAKYKTRWGAAQRTPLVLAVSQDGGLSFARRTAEYDVSLLKEFSSHCFLLEDDPADSYCYPAMIRTKDGYLVTYYCDGGSNRVLNYSRILKVSDAELNLV